MLVSLIHQFFYCSLLETFPGIVSAEIKTKWSVSSKFAVPLLEKLLSLKPEILTGRARHTCMYGCDKPYSISFISLSTVKKCWPKIISLQRKLTLNNYVTYVHRHIITCIRNLSYINTCIYCTHNVYVSIWYDEEKGITNTMVVLKNGTRHQTTHIVSYLHLPHLK